MKKLKNNKILIAFLILLVVMQLFSVLDFASSLVSSNGNFDINYVSVKKFKPKHLLKGSPKKIRTSFRIHKDKIDSGVNDFTMESYGFRSEATLFEKTGQSQAPSYVYIKSLDHEGLVIETPGYFSSDSKEFSVVDVDSEIVNIERQIINYLMNYAFYDEIKAINDELKQYMYEKGSMTWNQECIDELGYSPLFEVRGYTLNTELVAENKKELLEYFKTVKYQDYDKEKIKELVYKGLDKNGEPFILCRTSVFNKCGNLGVDYLEEFVNRCKEKNIQIPNFEYMLDNESEMIMYTMGPGGDITSNIVFNKRFEILSSAEYYWDIEDYEDRWCNPSKKERKW